MWTLVSHGEERSSEHTRVDFSHKEVPGLQLTPRNAGRASHKNGSKVAQLTKHLNKSWYLFQVDSNFDLEP